MCMSRRDGGKLVASCTILRARYSEAMSGLPSSKLDQSVDMPRADTKMVCR